MTRSVTAAGAGTLTAKTRYEIETGFDYAFLDRQRNGCPHQPSARARR